MERPNRPLSSRELLNRIGLGEDARHDLLGADELDDLNDLAGDLEAVLRERYASFNQHHAFAPGDLVTWKPSLRNRRVPLHGQPAIVMAVLETPVRDSDGESGSTYFQEPLDLVLGVIWHKEPNRGEFVTFHFDSRRFMPWRG